MRAILAALLFAVSTAVVAEPPQMVEVRRSFLESMQEKTDTRNCTVELVAPSPLGDPDFAGVVKFECSTMPRICLALLDSEQPLLSNPECYDNPSYTPKKDI